MSSENIINSGPIELEPIFLGLAEELNIEQEDKNIEDILEFELKENINVDT